MKRRTAIRAFLLALVLLPLTANVSQAAGLPLSWNPPVERVDGTPLPSSNIAGYNIYYGDVTGYYTKDIKVPVTDLPDPLNPAYTITGLTTCQVYYLVLTTYDDEGRESTYSSEVSKAALDAPTVSPPQPRGNDGLQISWTKVTADPGSVQSYNVYYDADSGEPYQGKGASQGASPINVAGDTRDIQLTGLPPGTTYVVVEATCPDGTTKRSAEVSGVTGNVIPGPDTGINPPPTDAGIPDGDPGSVQPDAGISPPPTDAGIPDGDPGGVQPDAGISPPPTDAGGVIDEPDSGMRDPQKNSGLTGGCTIASAPPLFPLGLLLVLVLVTRRRMPPPRP